MNDVVSTAAAAHATALILKLDRVTREQNAALPRDRFQLERNTFCVPAVNTAPTQK